MLILGAADIQHRTKKGVKRFKNVPLAECDLPQPETEDAAPVPAPAPRRKKAAKKATKKVARNTGADKAPSGAQPADWDLTMADLADGFLKHLEESGRSRGTTFSYSIDIGLAMKRFNCFTVDVQAIPDGQIKEIT